MPSIVNSTNPIWIITFCIAKSDVKNITFLGDGSIAIFGLAGTVTLTAATGSCYSTDSYS